MLFAGAAVAHHADTAWDHSRTLSVTGTVKSFLWANPHTRIYLEVTDSRGRTDLDSFEGGSVRAMRRNGWSRDALTVGDKIGISFHPRRDNPHDGMLIVATMADGRKLGWLPASAP